MKWVSFDKVFASNSKDYDDDLYDQEWGAWKKLIEKRDAALADTAKYTKYQKTEDEITM